MQHEIQICNLFLINSNLKIKIGKRLTHQKKNLKGMGGGVGGHVQSQPERNTNFCNSKY